MDRLETQEIVNVLSGAYRFLSAKPETVTAWHLALQPIPFRDAQHAVTRWIRTRTGTPTPSDILQTLNRGKDWKNPTSNQAFFTYAAPPTIFNDAVRCVIGTLRNGTGTHLLYGDYPHDSTYVSDGVRYASGYDTVHTSTHDQN